MLCNTERTFEHRSVTLRVSENESCESEQKNTSSKMSVQSPDCKPILCVGLLCVDVMNYIDHYPKEDSDNRMDDHRWALGGNAANNVTILTQLGARAKLLASIPSNGPMAAIVEALIAEARIDTELCLAREDGKLPISTAIINTSNGTRTIMHHPSNFSELQCAEFHIKIPDLTKYSWINFGGRNFDVTRDLLKFVRDAKTQNKDKLSTYPIISVEAEKIRPTPLLEQLIEFADVVFISKDFARKHGCDNKCDAATVICGWGESGASAISPSNQIFTSPSHKPSNRAILDTLGAGDTLIAACIHALNEGVMDLRQVLEYATKVAGKKCTQRGLVNIDLQITDDIVSV